MATVNRNFVIKNGLEVDGSTLVVDSTNDRVGIGLTNPIVALEVVSVANVNQLRLRPSNGNIDLRLNSSFGGVDVASLTVVGAHPLVFHTSNTERLRITSTGNIGIGTTNPTVKLSIGGETSQFATAMRIERTAHATSIRAGLSFGSDWLLGTDTSGTGVRDFFFYSNNLSLSPLRIDENGNLIINQLGAGAATGTASQPLQVSGGAYISGNVGIGTTNPIARLHINANTSTIMFSESDGSTNNKNWIFGAIAEAFYLQAQTDAYEGGGNVFRFTRSAQQINAFEGQNAGVTWFEVDNQNRRVGIRTDAPTTALDVRDGNIFVSTTDGGAITLYNRTSTVTSYPQLRIEHFTNGFGGFPVVELTASNGTSLGGTTVTSGQILGGFNTWGHNGTGLSSATRIEGIAEAQFSTSVSAGIRFATTAAGSQSERVRISGSGNVGISHTQPTSLLHIQSSDAVDVNYLRVSSKYGEYLRRIVVPTKTVAAGTPETFNLYLGRFYNGITKLHIYVEGGYAEEGSEFVFWKAWGNTSASNPVIKSRSGSSHTQINFHFQIVDVESYRVFISYTYNSGNVLGEANTLRAVIKSNSNMGVFFVESPNPTIPTLDSSNLMRTDFSIRADGHVGVGTSNPLWNLVVQENQDSGTVFQIRNDNTATAATSIIQLATSTGGTKYTNLVTSAGGNYFQNIGAGGITTLFQDYNIQVFRANAGTEAARLDSTTGTFQTTGPIYPGIAARGDANIELGRSRVLFTGATWTASASNTITITYNGHGFANSNRVDLVFTATSGSNATSGNYAVSNSTTNTFTITNPTSITGSGTCSIGSAGNSYIDLITDTTHADYGFRILRGNFGPNSDSIITNKGSGVITMQTEGPGSLRFLTNSSVNATEKMIITSIGNVGIGTTNPQTVFDVVGLGQFTADGATLNLVGGTHSYIQWFPDGYAAGRKAWTGFGNADSNSFTITNQISDGSGHIYLDPGANAAVLIDTGSATGTASQPLQVSGGAYISGNVGIGYTNPTYKLAVNGQAAIGGDKSLRLGEGSFTYYYDLGRDTTTGGFVIDGNQTGSVAYSFRKGGTSLLDIINSGNVGIGYTNPSTRLQVSGAIRIGRQDSSFEGGELRFARASDDADAFYMDVYGSGTSPRFRMFGGDGGVGEAFTVTWARNVGIGTDNPAEKLHVQGTISSRSGSGILNMSHDGSNGSLTSSSQLLLYAGGLNNLILHTNNTQRLFISSIGNVGIGTNTPISRLAVNGLITENPGDGVYYNVVTQRDVGFNANQIPLNQYLGQLAFLDQYSPSGLRRDGGGSDDLIIDSNGRIGIGTTLPAGQVGINTSPQWSSFNYGANLIISGSRNNGLGILDSGNTNPWWIGNGGGTLIFATMPALGDTTTGSSTRFTISNTGNVGIGTITPTHRLHIGPLNGNHLYLASGNNAFGWVVDTNDFGSGSVPMRIFRKTGGVDTESVTILNQSGNVGIGVTLPTYRLQVNGSFAATTKSFVIDHPTKPGFKLRYGSLEGPENGVYIRGKLSGNNTIELPEYWTELVDEESITVNLTPIGRNPGIHSVIDISDNSIVIESPNDVINCFFTVFAERKDVDKLLVEYQP